MNTKSGFTLIEILVVTAIIGMLGSIVLSSANNSRTASNNAATVSNIRNYELALQNYAQNSNGVYPNTGPNAFFCLGGTTCKIKNHSFNSSPVLDAALAPYLGGPPLPVINNLVMKDASGRIYQGSFYTCSITNGKCVNAVMYFIEAGNNSCARGTPAAFFAFSSVIGGAYTLTSPTDGTNTICGENLNNI